MDFDPIAWTPPDNPGLEGPYQENHRLAGAALWETGGLGPEDVAVSDAGVFTGLEDGRILRFDLDGGPPTRIAMTGGRPLGVEIHPDGGLVVADAYVGLLRVGDDGTVERLATEYQGERFALTNNSAVAADGTIYFSVSSHRRDLAHYTADLLEQRGTGRLYRRTPDGNLEVLLDGLVFANGVALAPDESVVLVAETGRYRIHRVWLTGDRAGQTDLFADALPGFPDNLSQDGGVVWCGFPRPRDEMLDSLMPRPWARRVVVRLPDRLQPKPSPHGFVVGYDLDGNIVHNLQDPSGKVAVTTAARRFGDRLFVGSLTRPAVAVLELGS